MVIKFRTDDIFESTMQVIVNPVNCVGVMGGGLAKAFKEKYPQMFEEYKKACDNGILTPGTLHFYQAEAPWEHSILNFPTKDDWRNPSEMSYIVSGLEEFVRAYESFGIVSIAFPALGSGLGGLNWDDVRPVMEKYLSNLDIDVEIYLPQ